MIGAGFYSNLFGFGLGGILSSLLGTFPIITITNIILFIASLSTFTFILAAVLVKNKPKVKI